MYQKFESFVIRGEDTEIAKKIDEILNKIANSQKYKIQHWTIATCIPGELNGWNGSTRCGLILTVCCNKK